MKDKKQKYYRLNKILEKKADYNMLLGERSNGKSYSVKECILWEAYNECDYEKWINKNVKEKKVRYQFAYLRRWREEIKTRDVESYFADMPIKEITNDEYDTVQCYRNDIYFAKTEDDGKIIRGKQIGSCFALTSATHYKSLSFPLIGNIVFEEFLTKFGYLPREVDNLLDILSTVARRDYVRVFLIGNTISRMCPYFDEWQLTHVKTQKQGTIEIYKQPTNQIDEDTGENIVVTIAVEYCESSGNNTKMFFGDKSKMITTGVWESEVYPHLDDNINTYKIYYKVLYKYNSFVFVINLLKDKNGLPFVFVYPRNNSDAKGIKRIVSDEFSSDKLTTLYLTSVTKYDNILIELINNKKVVFSDNLTGTEFYQILKERGRF